MAIEILILSGARRHERLVLEGDEFRAGADPACEVFFDPARDPAARGCGALLRREDDGWRVSPGGSGDLRVNQQAVRGSVRLRSGDVIGLSDSGPDFCFRLVAGGKEPLSAAAVAGTTTPPARSLPSATLVAAPAGRQDVAGGQTRQPLPSPSPSTRPWTGWTLGAIAAAVLLVILWRAFQPPIVVIVPGGKPADDMKADKPGDTAKADKPTDARKKAGQEQGDDKSGKGGVSPPPPAAELPRDAVFLVEVEKAGRFWPFATCVAVAKDTLLTSAREAMQMAAWRQKDGFKLWAFSPALGLRTEIREIRVHGVFATLAEKPSDWIYFNLALLSVDGELPKIAALASPEELEEVKEDAQVRCLSFPHEGEKTAADYPFQLQMVGGRILMTTVANHLPGRPRLLHVKAEIPPNAYGSPIFNEKGSLVGVYGAPADAADAEAPNAKSARTHIQLASIVIPEIIRRWTGNRDGKLWIIPPSPTSPTDQPAEGHNL
jgi:hypothetical protein